MSNIWEVVTVTDLIKLIKENPEKFVIVSFVLDTTPKLLQSFIKKFIKDKAKKFPNMTFLFFKVNKKDLGKFSLLDTNTDLYPLIYHLYDINNVFIKVTNAVKESIIEAFNKGEDYYLKDLEKYNTIKYKSNNQTNIQINNIKDNQDNQHNHNQDIKNNKNDKDVKDVNKNNKQEDDWEKQQLLMEEQQQMIAKIVNLQQKAKEYNLEILEDIKQRKKEEEKLKKK